MTSRHRTQKGQAIILVTLALIAMCGILGLAVDLGWSFFVRKAEQAAADAAAISATSRALAVVGAHDCTNLGCTTAPVNCSSITSGNLLSACQYAAQNGFTDDPNGRTHVTVDANVCDGTLACTTGRYPPTVCAGPDSVSRCNSVAVQYWVTVRVSQSIPQLFSAVLGNTNGLVAARATAAITNVVFQAGLDLLNRQNDPGPVVGAGVNMNQGGSSQVSSPGGIFAASAQVGAALQNGQQAKVYNTPISQFRGTGTCVPSGQGSCNWDKPWTHGMDGNQFMDPTTGRDQPPLGASTTNIPVPVTNKGAGLSAAAISGSGTATDPFILRPGNYYAATCTGTPQVCTATGDPLLFDNPSGGGSPYFAFTPNGRTNTTWSDSSQYVFYGGLADVGGSANVTFTPGRYVFAGTANGNASFQVGNQTTLKDSYTGSDADYGKSSYPGEIFIYTNQNYTAGNTRLNIPPDVQTALSSGTGNFSASSWDYGETGLKAGNNAQSSVSLHGLNRGAVPSDLNDWTPFVMWQDRGNSYIHITPGNGYVDSALVGGCAGGSAPETGSSYNGDSVDVACTVARTHPNSPQLDLSATPTFKLVGAVYQPRGAWLNLQGGGALSGPIQIITGALNAQGGPGVILTGFAEPITTTTTALIE